MPKTNSPTLVPDSARRLDVFRVALELITVCQPDVDRRRRFDRRRGDQLAESLCSTLQSLVEALRPTGKDRAHLLTVALGSGEQARGPSCRRRWPSTCCPRPSGGAPRTCADRACAMLYRLRQRCA